MTVFDARSVSPLLDLLFDGSEVGRCLVAPDGSVLRANQTWLRSTGFRLDDVLGANILDLFPETHDMALALHARARAGHHVEVPRHAQTVNGRETWWEGSIDPVPMEGGTGLLITARETSVGASPPAKGPGVPRARGEEAPDGTEGWYRAAFDVTTSAIQIGELLFDAGGKPVDVKMLAVNPAYEKHTGLLANQVVRRRIREVIPQIEQVWFDRYAEMIRGGTPIQFEDHVESMDMWFEVHAGPLGGNRFIAIFSDITARKRSDRDGRASSVVEVNADVTERRRAEARLAHVASFPEMNPNPIVEATLDGRVTYANPSALRLFPDIREQGVAHPWFARWEGVERSIRDGGPIGERIVSVGERSFFQVIIQLPGPAVRTYGTDITERVRAEHALRAKEAEFAVVLERTPFMHTRCSRDLRYLYVSRAYAEMLGRTPAEVSGKSIVEIMGEQGLETIRPHVETVLSGQRVEYEAAVHFTGVGERLLHVVYVPDTDEHGQVIGWVASIIDVTERREEQDALRVANARLLEADRRKNEFLAVLSHELRNPLAPIRNSVYLLERAAPGTEQFTRAKDVLRRQADHLARLVDDLLDVMRITRGKVELQRRRVDLREIVRKSMDDIRSLFERRGITLRVEHALGPVWLDADPTRMAQMIGNVLHNAHKFTPAGGVVTVSMVTEDGRVRLAVTDTGIGMIPGQEERMFEQFAQGAQDTARTAGGLGLGLSLVKSLVELHGGSVSARSEGPGRGTEIVMRLPLAESSGIAVPPAPVQTVSASRDVLVIEDNPDAAEMLAGVLALQGHTVRVATDGRAGLALAAERTPDVILCDLGLPGMDGCEVAKAVRGDPVLARVQLVALTGYAQPEDRQRTSEAGFDAHLAKPLDIDELTRLLRPGEY